MRWVARWIGGTRCRGNEVLVEKARVGAQHIVERGGRHDRTHGRDLVDPERGDGVGIFPGLADRAGEAPQRLAHPDQRGVDGRRLVEIDPRDAQVRRVREPGRRRLAPFERPRQRDVFGCANQVVPISYYSETEQDERGQGWRAGGREGGNGRWEGCQAGKGR